MLRRLVGYIRSYFEESLALSFYVSRPLTFPQGEAESNWDPPMTAIDIAISALLRWQQRSLDRKTKGTNKRSL